MYWMMSRVWQNQQFHGIQIIPKYPKSFRNCMCYLLIKINTLIILYPCVDCVIGQSTRSSATFKLIFCTLRISVYLYLCGFITYFKCDKMHMYCKNPMLVIWLNFLSINNSVISDLCFYSRVHTGPFLTDDHL